MTRKDQGKKIKSGLGRALVKTQSQKNRARRQHQANEYIHTTDEPEALQSVVERTNLDEFLNDAMLKDQKFEAERQNFQLIDTRETGPQIVFPHEKRPELFDYEAIPIPRRPPWTKEMTAEELDRDERETFVAWRRLLSNMEENTDDLKMTPFEKSLGIWRQLWRVMERCDLVCQIVDARNPLLFRSKDLEKYAAELTDKKRKCLLIINKADYLSVYMRTIWASYFKSQGVHCVFFSAVASQTVLDAQAKKEREEAQGSNQSRLAKGLKADTIEQGEEEEEDEQERLAEDLTEAVTLEQGEEGVGEQADTDTTRIYSRQELLDYFKVFMDWPNTSSPSSPSSPSPSASSPNKHDGRLVVGMVGYPNVGKSSTINVLAAQKRVNVGATPGKTKHFQTLYIDDDTMLCDCPGLVFPTFMESTANLVCNGILPIDQLRDYIGPCQEICRRISREQFASVYSLDIPHWKQIDATELTEAHARLRSFAKSHGGWDNSRSARILLKDFVNGKLLYCHPPPGLSKEERAAFANSLVSERLLAYDEEDEDSGADIVPVAMQIPADKKLNVLAVQAMSKSAEEGSDVALAVQKPPQKLPITKKQMRRMAKGKKNKHVKGKYATEGGHGAHIMQVVPGGLN